jgi:hypothetical protein
MHVGTEVACTLNFLVWLMFFSSVIYTRRVSYVIDGIMSYKADIRMKGTSDYD